jgi:hypothetical protein
MGERCVLIAGGGGGDSGERGGGLLTQAAKRDAGCIMKLRVYARGFARARGNALTLAARCEANAIDSRRFCRPDLAPRARGGAEGCATESSTAPSGIAFPYSSSPRH